MGATAGASASVGAPIYGRSEHGVVRAHCHPRTIFLDDAWLSGFIDGEGCFTHDGAGRPRFSIGLRWDDEYILTRLLLDIGGGLYNFRGNGNSQASARWVIWNREELRMLVWYLERFPLRAKKAEQFAAWRKEFSL